MKTEKIMDWRGVRTDGDWPGECSRATEDRRLLRTTENCTNLADSVDVCDVLRKSPEVVEQRHTVGQFQQLVFVVLEEGHSEPEQYLRGWGE